MNIPLGSAPLESLGGTLNKIMAQAQEQALKRQQMRDMAAYHKADLDLRKQALSQSHGFDPLKRMMMQLQIDQLKHKNDPSWQAQQLMQTMNAFGGGMGGEQPQQPQQMPEMQGQEIPNMPPLAPDNSGNPNVSYDGPGPIDSGNPFVGRAGYKAPQQDMSALQSHIQSMQGQQQASPNNMLEMAKKNPILAGFLKKQYGMDVNAETPEMKQQRAVETNRAKVEDADKIAQAKEDRKIIQGYKADKPHIEEALKSLTQMQKIITENPDLFGHPGRTGEWFKQVSHNKNLGTMINDLIPAIVDTEQKLSQRGNQLALKVSTSKLPDVTDTQEVALGKVEAQINRVKESLNRTNQMLGETSQSAQPEVEAEKVLNGKTYHKIKGKWHELR